jgi:hypothetical protein
MEIIKITLGTLFLATLFFGYFMNIYSQLRYGRTLDIMMIFLPVVVGGVRLYVKAETKIKAIRKGRD